MRNFADEIKTSVSMRDICNKYGIDTNNAGFARCCFHDEKTASMKAYSGSDGFHCFGCGAHGSVIDFVMMFFGLDFPSACEKLNADFGLGLPIGRVPTLREQREAERKSKERREQLEAKRAERERLENAYHKALDKYVRLDIQKRIFEPHNSGEEFHPKYVEALRYIAQAEYFLDIAEDNLYEFNRRSNS